MVAAPNRRILIHYHIFKNAGTSVEQSLDEVFGQQLYRFETDQPDGHLTREDAHELIMANPDLRAVTSHQLHPPVPAGPYDVFPLLVLREPISRVRSAYLFEWQRQLGLDEPKGSFADYVALKLDNHGPGVISNFQVSRLARYWMKQRGLRHTELDAALEVATEFVQSLPIFGLVDRFAASVEMINHELQSFYGNDEVQIEYRHDNITQDPDATVGEVRDLISEELGEALFTQLVMRNTHDIELYRWASDLFDWAVAERYTDTPTCGPNVITPSKRIPSADVTIDADAELVQLQRRIRWQDELLAKVGSDREAGQAELTDLKKQLAQMEHELAVSRSMSELSSGPAAPASLRHRLRLRLPLGFLRGSAVKQSSESEPVRSPVNNHAELIAESGLFDPVFYAERNPDVVASGQSALDHYLDYGGLERRSASQRFDSGRYLQEYPDVGRAGTNPLVHYLLHGRGEGRFAFTVGGEQIHSEPDDLPAAADFDEICGRLKYIEHIDVDVSIIIPIYNAVDYTIACLESVHAMQTSYRYEVIVMDDRSDDPDVGVLNRVVGLRYVRNLTNLGFLRNCNAAVDEARGRLIVFLNNHTRVDADWLDPLVETLLGDPNVGLVGSKLVFPDGRLQEAGGVIFSDGSGWNVGRLQNPHHPEFNYRRDVDYISGASIMLDRLYFDKLGRFDESFAPAYYEDMDLSFKIRADNRRVVYQPMSQLVRYDGVWSGTNTSTGVKKYQSINRPTFATKWHDVLQREHFSGSQELCKAVDRHYTGRVLVLDSTTPTPDQDSGSIDMFNLLKILSNLGYQVHFVPTEDMVHSGRYTTELQNVGVKCVYKPFYETLVDYLDDVGDIFDLAILSRVNVAAATIHDVQSYCPSARTVFYTVDLHFLRRQRQAELEGSRQAKAAAGRIRDQALSVMDHVDSTVVLSDHERRILSEIGKTNVKVIPLIRQISDHDIAPFDHRTGAVFIGGFRHPPNVDAVDWLISDIWPLVRQRREEASLDGEFVLRVVGSNAPRRFRTYPDDIEVYGFVENLGPIMHRSLLTVAPLRYRAGLKGKVATSFDYGLPVVGTSIAFEGMPENGLENVSIVGDTAPDIADLIVSMSTSRQRWTQFSAAGRAFITRHYSIEAVTPAVASLIHQDSAAPANTTSGD